MMGRQKMTNDEFNKIREDYIHIGADLTLGKSISKHYDIICKNIAIMNDFILDLSDEDLEKPHLILVIRLCHQYYLFKDEASSDRPV